jgi:hypothetical protein
VPGRPQGRPCSLGPQPLFDLRESPEQGAVPHRPRPAATQHTPLATVRKLAANRDQNRCRFDGPDCYGWLEAHHLVAVKFGGAPFDLDNIALTCKRHHFLLERETRMRAQGTLRD